MGPRARRQAQATRSGNGAVDQVGSDDLSNAAHHDAARLAWIDGVAPFVCDVTDDDQIARLRAAVEARGAGLWGVVNNAGIAQFGHLTDTPLDHLRDVFEVNVFGVHRVTNAFVDLIVASGGRNVNVSSISGTLSSEFMGPYSMSKHALGAYTDSLAAQLAGSGVHVGAVAPGNFESRAPSAVVRSGIGWVGSFRVGELALVVGWGCVTAA